MGLRRRVAVPEAAVPHLVRIRSPLKRLGGRKLSNGSDVDGEKDEDVVAVDARWWAECAVLVFVTIAVALRVPHARAADRAAVLACVVGGMALASVADASRHLHFCRVGIDTGLVPGACLVPLVILVQSSLAPNTPQWRVYFWLSVAMTMSALAWLAAIKLGALGAEVPRFFELHQRDSVSGAVGYVLLAAHCGGVFGTPCPAWLAVVYGVAMFGLTCRGLASTVPQSFTLGEATILAQTTVLLLVELCFHIGGGPTVLPRGASSQVFTACVLAGAAALVLTWLPASMWVCRPSGPRANERAHTLRVRSHMWAVQVQPFRFTVFLAASIGAIALPATSAALGQGPVHWLVNYVLSHSLHVWALMYWAVCLAVAAPAIHAASTDLEREAPPLVDTTDETPVDEAVQKAWHRRRRLFYRKLYHFLTLVLFFPVLLGDPEFLSVGSASALLLMAVMECLRVTDVPPLGKMLHDLMDRYRDEKDPGELLTTHMYLLIACAAPLWLSCATTTAPAITGLGLVAIGLGDATASVAGGRWGATRIFGTRKTIEGTVASAVVQAIAVMVLCAVSSPGASPPALAPTIVAVVVGAVYEALTLQSDNLVIPLIVWALAASNVAASRADAHL